MPEFAPHAVAAGDQPVEPVGIADCSFRQRPQAPGFGFGAIYAALAVTDGMVSGG